MSYEHDAGREYPLGGGSAGDLGASTRRRTKLPETGTETGGTPTAWGTEWAPTAKRTDARFVIRIPNTEKCRGAEAS